MTIIIGFIMVFLVILFVAIFAEFDDWWQKRERQHYVGGSHTVRNYDGETRYINGQPVKTPDDLDEWWVLKGFSEAIAGRLGELMRLAEEGDISDYADARAEWNTLYTRLRDLCICHKLWNPAIGDRRIFVPTQSQLYAEEDLRSRFEEACELGIDFAYTRDRMRKEILDHLQMRPQHSDVRQNMVRKLAGDDAERKKLYRKECSRMAADGLLSETHDEKGRLVVKKKRKRVSSQDTPIVMEPSVFHPEIYKSIDHRMWSKVKYTVGQPENVDRQKNCCEFHSLSRGELYHTSLTQCTCEAFISGYFPCKHMVALAKYLKYI